uniref:WW domain-containing protein n=2 Tax=Hanusia phi TaxID=3032 RepID=A0A7S0HSZ4_9CRYP
METYSLNAIHAEERVRWGTPGSLPSELEHELEWELLPRTHLFFLSYKNHAPELWKQLLSQSEDCKLLAWHAHCRFTDLTMAEARVPVISEMADVANSFGLQLAKEEILDDCGYCPALCLRNKCVVIDVVDKSDLVLVNNTSLLSDGNLRLKGWVKLKHEVLHAMGWNVLTILKERWESLAGQDLEKARYLFDSSRLRPYLTELRANLNDPDLALRAVTDRNSAILFVERLVCVYGNLRILQPNHIVTIYKLLLNSPPVNQARLASALMGSGLQERTFEVVRALSVQDIVFLAEAMTKFLVELELTPYGSSRMEVRIKPELIQEVVRWTQEDRMCALTGRVWADAIGRWASALSKLSKEAIESVSAAVHSVLLLCHKPEYLSLLVGDPLCSILVASGKFPTAYHSTVSSAVNIVLERIMSPEIFSSLTAQQVVELLGAYPYCGHYNLRAFRTMVDQAASLLSGMTSHHIAMIARAHIRNMQSIEIIQPMLTSRLLQISDETSGGQWILLKDCVSILVSLGLLGLHDDKLENVLLHAVHTTCERELKGSVPFDVTAELLWVISLCRYSNQENAEIERVQVKLVSDIVIAWESGNLFFGESRPIKMGSDKEAGSKHVLDDMHVAMLMQYCVWLRQRGAAAEVIISQLSEGYQAVEDTLRQIGIEMDARRVAGNSEIFDDIAEVLTSMNTKFDRATAVYECGSSLGFKLHGAATTIEIYARDDCMQSSSQRGLSHKPAGLWIQRLNLLKRSGLMVLVVGFEQWGGLKKAEVLEGGEQPQARSEWLMKLINTSAWAKSLEAPAGISAGSVGESGPWQMSMQVEQDEYSSGSDFAELGSVSSRGSHVGSVEHDSTSHRGASAEGDKFKPEDAKAKRMRQEGKLWTVHWSKGRNAWFYHNSETKQKVWKPPTVPGWIIKTGSGDHPPYVGLLHYYFNPESGQIAYEPPNA